MKQYAIALYLFGTIFSLAMSGAERQQVLFKPYKAVSFVPVAQAPASPEVDICTLRDVTCEKPSVKDTILAIAHKERFKWPSYLVRLAYCESRLNAFATNDNGRYGLDRGVFQIKNRYHPEVSDNQAFDVEYATRWTIDMINSGRQHEWACNKIVLAKR